MISPDDVVIPVQSAVAEYFTGERREMLLILGGSAVFTALAVWLWVATRSGFALAFAVTVLAAAVLLSAMGGSLLVRDKALSATIRQSIESPRKASVVLAEHERVGVILSKYRYYRYGAAIIAAISLFGLMFSDRGWIHGVAAGLLLLVVAQVLIDHFSERRAGLYHNRLAATAAAAGH